MNCNMDCYQVYPYQKDDIRNAKPHLFSKDYQWFRRQFKNAKIPGFEHDIVSLACADWVSSGGQLVKN